MADLLEQIELQSVECLNEQPGKAWANAVRGGEESWICWIERVAGPCLL